MKRLLLLCLIPLLLWGCSATEPPEREPDPTSEAQFPPEESPQPEPPPEPEEPSQPEPSQPEQDPDQSYTFTQPVIMARHHFPDGIVAGGPPATLYLEITDGTYDAEQATWANTWSGPSYFRVEIEGQPDVISEGGYHFGFYDKFGFAIADYNGDGQPDFVISQWGAMSAGDGAAMFTVTPGGAVELLVGQRRSAQAHRLRFNRCG